MLLHLVDGTSPTIAKDYKTIVAELDAYSGLLADKPRITALNKIDALDARTLASRRRSLEKASGGAVHLISGVAGTGVQEALRALYRIIADERGADETAGDQGGAWQP